MGHHHENWHAPGAPDARKAAQWFTCATHKKRTWFDRKEARKAATRAGKRNGGHMREYRCDAPATDGWHIGHVRPEIIAGDTTARETYGRWKK